MAVLNFPSSPSNGDTYVENGVTYTYSGTFPNGFWKADNQNSVTDVFVNTNGDTMTGNLNITPLGGNGNVTLYANNSGQLIASDGTETLTSPFVDKSGSTMTGDLLFSAAQITNSGGKAKFGGTGTPTEVAELFAVGNDVALELNSNDTKKAKLQLSSGNLELRGSDGAIKFYGGNADGDASTELAQLNSSGQLLLGTTSASSYSDRYLSVGDTANTSSRIEVRSATNGISGIVFSDGTALDNSGQRGAVEYDHTLDALCLKTSGTEIFRIDSTGQVGVGTLTPDATLHVESAAATAGWQIRTNSNGVSNQSGFYRDVSDNYELHLLNGGGGISYIKNGGGATTAHLSFNVQGSEALHIDSNQNVGVGTNLPTGKLQVKGAVNYEATNSTNVWNVYTHTNNDLRFNYNASGDDEVVIDATGKIGVGELTPAANIEIQGTNQTDTFIAGADGTNFTVYNDDTAGEVRLKAEDGTGTAATYLSVYTQPAGNSPAERVVVASDGKVGIGASTPLADVHISYGSDTDGSSSSLALGGTVANDRQGVIEKVNAVDDRPLQIRASADATGAPIEFFTSSSLQAITIAADGKLGAGTQSPDNIIHIQASDTSQVWSDVATDVIKLEGADVSLNLTTTGTGTISFSDADARSQGAIDYVHAADELRLSTGGSERFRIGSGGTLSSLGTANLSLHNTNAAGTTDTLIVGGHSASNISTSTASFRVWTNGNVENTNNNYGALSDEKLKENIVEAQSQWADIKAVKFRKYNFKEETGQETYTQLGVIAQELELVSPGLVNTIPDTRRVFVGEFDENGDPVTDGNGNQVGEYQDIPTGTSTKSVKYSVLTMKALVALQEAMQRIEYLEARVTALES